MEKYGRKEGESLVEWSWTSAIDRKILKCENNMSLCLTLEKLMPRTQLSVQWSIMYWNGFIHTCGLAVRQYVRRQPSCQDVMLAVNVPVKRRYLQVCTCHRLCTTLIAIPTNVSMADWLMKWQDWFRQSCANVSLALLKQICANNYYVTRGHFITPTFYIFTRIVHELYHGQLQ